MKEKIESLDNYIKALVMQRRIILSDAQNPERVRREIERLRERIVAIQAEIETLEFRLSCWRELVQDIDAQISNLRHEREMLANKDKVMKLKELEKAAAELRQQVS